MVPARNRGARERHDSEVIGRRSSEVRPIGDDQDDLRQRIAALPDLDRAELEARWRRIYRRDPPPRTSRELMVRAIAYHLQVEVHGDLDRRSRRRLAQLVADIRGGKPTTAPSPRIKPGTRLIREWHGDVHEVLVLEEGFAFRGQIHRSLTAITKEITGTSWNGHVFFGLKKRLGRSTSAHADIPKPPDIRAPEPADA